MGFARKWLRTFKFVRLLVDDQTSQEESPAGSQVELVRRSQACNEPIPVIESPIMNRETNLLIEDNVCSWQRVSSTHLPS